MQELDFDVFFVHVSEVVISSLHLILLLVIDDVAMPCEYGLVHALGVVILLVRVFNFYGRDLIATIHRLDLVDLYQLLLFIYSGGSYDFWQF